MKQFFFIGCLLLLLSACEKAIDLQPDAVPPKLVVEAIIETGEPPVVFLSRSYSFFSAISPSLLESSFVHDAIIHVSNGNLKHRLKENSRPLPNGSRIYFYSLDSASLATAFTGQLRTSYSLEILSEGKTYTATTTIPSFHKQLDSIWFQPVQGDTGRRQVLVYVRATDPPGFGDYVRYWTKRNSEPFLPGFTSVYDDLVIDGTTYNSVVEPGIDRNADKNDFDTRSFKRGDTVTLKLSGIDRATYDFWRTMEFSYSSIGNPFSSPVKVLGNISNGALGYFGGYASQYKTIVIPR